MADDTQYDIADLIAERNQLVDALDVLPEAFVLYDANDCLVHCNDRYKEFYASSADLIEPGRTFEEIIREGVARGQYQDAKGQEEIWIAERLKAHQNPGDTIEQKLGNGKWLRIVERKTQDGGTVGFRIDITELKQREEALRMSSDRMRATVESALDCIIMIDSEGLVIEFNPAAESTFGYARQDAMGRALSDLIIPERLRDAHVQGMRHFLKTGEGPILGKRIEVQAIKSDNTEFLTELAVETAENENGTVFIAYLRDITARHESDQALRDAKEHAEEANRAKANFLAMMSHEIRTPINGVLGVLGLLMDTPLDEEQNNYVLTGRNSAEALLDIINDILDFSKIEAGKLDFEYTEFSLNDLVDGSRSLIEQRANEKGITLLYQINDDIPDNLVGDPGRIQQTLLNLVSNAVKFTDEGSVNINGSLISDTIDSTKIRFEVTDTGIGIPFDKHAELFSEFTMVDNSFTRNSEGTGLGLAISKKIIEMMNGEIGFDSQPGKGSTFWFEITLKKENSGKPNKARCAPRNPLSDKKRVAAVHRGKPGRILIAEDNAVNQLVTKTVLEKVGYRVDVASNGKEALKAVIDLPYDAVLMDVSMPEMDGLEATIKIRALPSRKANIPVIALTAHAMKEDKARVFEAGMNDYISKPAKRDELLEILDLWVHERPWPEYDATLHNIEDKNVKTIETPILDRQALVQLAEDTDIKIVPDLVSSFSKDVRQRIERIWTAMDKLDLETLELESHTLGSSSATFGAMQLHVLMRSMETACREKNTNDLEKLATRINEIMKDSLEALEEYVSDI